MPHARPPRTSERPRLLHLVAGGVVSTLVRAAVDWILAHVHH
ncbi:hypothetical protein [Embleya sp. NPDC020630]